jgi:hypothetical protein
VDAELRQSLSDYLEGACKAQSVRAITWGRNGILAMDRAWVLRNTDAIAKAALNLTDEWEFRRLLEVYELLDPDLLRGLVVVGQQSRAQEIREAAEDFAGKI